MEQTGNCGSRRVDDAVRLCRSHGGRGRRVCASDANAGKPRAAVAVSTGQHPSEEMQVAATNPAIGKLAWIGYGRGG